MERTASPITRKRRRQERKAAVSEQVTLLRNIRRHSEAYHTALSADLVKGGCVIALLNAVYEAEDAPIDRSERPFANIQNWSTVVEVCTKHGMPHATEINVSDVATGTYNKAALALFAEISDAAEEKFGPLP